MDIAQITPALQFFVRFVDQINFLYILHSEYDYILNIFKKNINYLYSANYWLNRCIILIRLPLLFTGLGRY